MLAVSDTVGLGTGEEKTQRQRGTGIWSEMCNEVVWEFIYDAYESWSMGLWHDV